MSSGASDCVELPPGLRAFLFDQLEGKGFSYISSLGWESDDDYAAATKALRRGLDEAVEASLVPHCAMEVLRFGFSEALRWRASTGALTAVQPTNEMVATAWCSAWTLLVHLTRTPIDEEGSNSFDDLIVAITLATFGMPAELWLDAECAINRLRALDPDETRFRHYTLAMYCVRAARHRRELSQFLESPRRDLGLDEQHRTEKGTALEPVRADPPQVGRAILGSYWERHLSKRWEEILTEAGETASGPSEDTRLLREMLAYSGQS